MKKLVILTGPTASGKTDVALAFSKKIPCEMISCDSMQVYKRMPIVTQAPPREVTRKLKTHLVSFLEPSEEYSAARFREDALQAIADIEKRGRLPLLVGGTGLYLRALLDGLFGTAEELPARDDKFRERLAREAEECGADSIHSRLCRVDPLSASKIHPNDVRRVIRALEVFHLTGRPMSVQKSQRSGLRALYDCPIFFLDRDREDLYSRINLRVDRMLKNGLLSEVKRLQKKRLSKTAAMALGIREIGSYLAGDLELEEALELIKQRSRNYAKRQIAWFRHEQGVRFVPVGRTETAHQTALKLWDLCRKER